MRLRAFFTTAAVPALPAIFALAPPAAVPADSAAEPAAAPPAGPAAEPAGPPAGFRLPPGSVVAGVDLGGLGPNGAKRELRRMVSRWHQRPLTVRGRGRAIESSATLAGLSIDYEGMIRSAFDIAARGEPVQLALSQSIRKRRLRRTVRRAAKAFYKPPRNARVRFRVRRVKKVRQRPGRAVRRKRLRRAIKSELLEPSERRVVRARFRRVRPRARLRDLRRVHHTFVSVHRRRFILRLFKRLRVKRRYRIAVGTSGYETPRGLRSILSKQVNPAWHAPNRPWAGALAGQTIPAGDPRNPLKARFIALGGGYGIHGTAEEWTLGTRASHGCIRMSVSDVKHLFRRVHVDTPVLIR